MKVKVIKEHMKDCNALRHVEKGWWSNPLFITDETFYLDKSGGKRGSTTRWRLCICNSTDCQAKVIVKERWLENLIQQEVNQQK